MNIRNFVELNLVFILLISVLAESSPKGIKFGTKSENNIPRNLENLNFIKVKYKENAEYPSGFGNTFRNDSNLIKIKLGENVYELNETLTIQANETIEIHFSNPIQSLKNFFGYISNFNQGDENHNKIISVDFTNFDSSSITEMNFLFYECNSIEEINFKNFKTSSVEDMSYIFYNCKALKSLDLSDFIAKSVLNISNIFNGCNSLEFLDITNFDTTNVEKADNAFKGLNNIKYINLYYAKINKIFQNSISTINKKND